MFKTFSARVVTLRLVIVIHHPRTTRLCDRKEIRMKINALVPTLLLGATLALPASVLAQDGDFGPSSSVQWSNCKVAQVATFADRVHVHCVTGVYPYFASPTSNSAEATRLVTLGTAAMMGAGTLWILSDMRKQDAAAYGCALNDCRRPIEIQLNK
jgi:hypothetical protein